MMPLVRTKLQPPEARPSLLARPRLYEWLRHALHSRVVLITAPAGYGKTSLLAVWIGESGKEWSQIAWLTLDAADNDLRRLFAYLLEALPHLSPTRRAQLQALLETEAGLDAEQWCAELLNDLVEIGDATIMVFDDYHTITDNQIHHAIAFLVEHLPPRCRLIIATRSDPPLPLARWRARGQLAELRSFDLAFTPEEAAAFLLEEMELPLEREQIVALLESTEGWPAGLHLAALALRHHPHQDKLVNAIISGNRYVVDYLIEDVFNQQPFHIQQFLLQTSILDRLCGPLCDAVIGINEREINEQSHSSYSQSILTELERNNLFLFPLDTERNWYRYHHLFADVLRERLETGSSPDRIALLHRRAGAWFAAHGMLPLAINHALRAQAFDDVVAMIEPIGLAVVSQVGEATLRRWLPQIPDTAFEQHPRLALLRAWLATTDYQMEDAAYWIAVAERALAGVASGTATSFGPIANLRGELSAVRVRLAVLRGDNDRVLQEGQQALAWLQTDNQALRMRVAKDLGYAYFAQGDLMRAEQAFSEAIVNGFNAGLPYISAMATSDDAYTKALRGSIGAAIQTCRETINHMLRRNRDRASPGIGLPFLTLADLHGVRHEFAGALPALAEAESSIKPGNTTSYLCLLIVTARINRARGDVAGALRVVRQARFLARQRKIDWVLAVLNGFEAQLALEQGDLVTAEYLLEAQLHPPVEFRMMPIAAFYAREHIIRAQYEWRLARARAAGDSAELHALAAALAAPTQGETWQMLAPLDAALLRALALLAAGEDATDLIVTALDLATVERIVTPFVQAGEPLRIVLNRLSVRQRLPAYGEYLLSLIDNDEPLPMSMPVTSAPPTLPEPLSQREIEVLRLMAEGRSNHEIATSLVIAVSTVKSHINNIFNKLGVASRTQAVARGRRLGLIP
ncbi:LuxR C-terminal-related transcriptional regulator [Chloroflexus aggregans]|uniref:ATP-dependent transcriptional regulator, MalT-like, LuxR family n=1 Tax=Chloroflexus aggregans (strain MD-66 / DSM 9485) TaxID=326427 RepID=B8G442_CHLAD|nr:LuxR C-terminal-related transcriptional regulator [Chloroflexus aggregans]ACL25444.1 ATP-dependent transcriptional regulator, MalT-like, LuxR family [Chloroflexus aggregans DSM 9485]